MKSTINWIDSEEQIALIDSIGLWNSSDLLESVEFILSKAPQYLILNPSNVMFPEAYMHSYETSDQSRKTALDLMVKALLEQTLKLIIIIQTKDLPVFDVIHTAYAQNGVGHLMKFVDSLTSAQELIASHEAGD